MTNRIGSNTQVPPSHRPAQTAAPTAKRGQSELLGAVQKLAHGVQDAFHSGAALLGSRLLHLPAAHAGGAPLRTPAGKDPISAASSAAPGPTGVNGLPNTIPTDPGCPPQLKQIGHVWVIMMENQDWSNVKGSKDAPFINNTLLQEGAHAENYVASTHPSEPNYLELEAGSTLGVTDDGTPQANHQATHDHLTA